MYVWLYVACTLSVVCSLAAAEDLYEKKREGITKSEELASSRSLFCISIHLARLGWKMHIISIDADDNSLVSRGE